MEVSLIDFARVNHDARSQSLHETQGGSDTSLPTHGRWRVDDRIRGVRAHRHFAERLERNDLDGLGNAFHKGWTCVWASLLIAVVGGCVNGPSPQASASTIVNSGPTAITKGSGVSFLVALDRPDLRPGEHVSATLTATNTSEVEVTYPGSARNECLLVGSFWIDFDALTIPSGNELTGVSGRIKDGVLAALVDGVSLPAEIAEARPNCELSSVPLCLGPGSQSAQSESGTAD